MKQIHNSKQCMPSILTDELAWDWLMTRPINGKLIPEQEARLSEMALTQIPSRLLETCTIDRNYRTTLEATQL